MAGLPSTDAHLDIAEACSRVGAITRQRLMSAAVARGARHYAGIVNAESLDPLTDIPHEVLGCALLVGPHDVETFQAARVGSAVLSDLENSPKRIAEAASVLGVRERVAHLAMVGGEYDEYPDFWTAILTAVGVTPSSAEREFMPSLSRVTVQIGLRGAGRGASHQWLRTRWAR